VIFRPWNARDLQSYSEFQPRLESVIMKKLLTTTALAAVLAVSAHSSAQAEDLNVYISVYGGGAFTQDMDLLYDPVNSANFNPQNYTYDTGMGNGFIIGGAIGAHVTENLRLELDVTYYTADPDGMVSPNGDTGDTVRSSYTALTVLGNVWYDYALSDMTTIYAGAGAGVTWSDSEFVSALGNQNQWDNRESNFTYQLGAGAKFALDENWSLDVGYRYRSVVAREFDGGASPWESDNINSHIVQVGISYKF